MRSLSIALAAFFAGSSGLIADERLTVYAVNGPLQYFAERLAGETADVRMPVPVGRAPSLWEPSIADISAIQDADLIVLNGADYAGWTTRASLPRSRTIDTSRAFADRFIATETITHSHGADGEHSHTGTASHTWLDFGQAAMQAEAIAGGLTRLQPERAEEIAAALAALQGDLTDLDARARNLQVPDGVPVVASHPRYQYFARAYGVDVTSMAWDSATRPNEEAWAELEALVGAGPAVMIWEAEPLPEISDRLDTLGVTVVVVPTFASTPDHGDFVAAMHIAITDLGAALGQ